MESLEQKSRWRGETYRSSKRGFSRYDQGQVMVLLDRDNLILDCLACRMNFSKRKRRCKMILTVFRSPLRTALRQRFYIFVGSSTPKSTHIRLRSRNTRASSRNLKKNSPFWNRICSRRNLILRLWNRMKQRIRDYQGRRHVRNMFGRPGRNPRNVRTSCDEF